jgi:MFS transporter, MHS family, proline/betaine transporter
MSSNGMTSSSTAFLATVIAQNFFPAGNETAALLATFAVFGVGFVARPLGAVVLGWIGDRHGRKTALLLTILLMAASTVSIGLIPTYQTIGVLAPMLLLLARLVQGFSVGGEWGNSTAFIVEWAPQAHRGFYGSLQQSSVVAGLLLGSAIAASLNSVLEPAAMQSWGWRVPFVIGGLIGPVGVYMRRNVEETPAYARAKKEINRRKPAPLLKTAQAFGLMIISAVQFYIFLAYMPTFTRKYAQLGPAEALWSNTAGLLLLMVAIPVLGSFADRVGRKPLLIASCLATIFLPYPLFHVMVGGASFGLVLATQLLIAVVIALYCAALPAAIAEIFETRSRTTYLSVANGTAVAIFGGFAPFAATWLIDRTASPIAPVDGNPHAPRDFAQRAELRWSEPKRHQLSNVRHGQACEGLGEYHGERHAHDRKAADD